MITKIKKRLALQISFIILAMVLLCAVLVGVSSYVLYRGDSIASNADRALAVGQSVAALIDAEKFEAIMASGEKTDYWLEVKAILDDIKVRTGVKYLYVLDANYTDQMTYFAEGYDAANDTEAELDLGYREDIVIDGVDTYAEEMFETLATGQTTVTDTYDSGDFGMMVSGFAAVKDPSGRVVGVVGVDISLAEVMRAVSAFAWRIIIIILVFCVLAGLFSVWYINRRIGVPLGRLAKRARRLSVGDMNVEMDVERQDEIGVLADAFGEVAQHTRQQADMLVRMSEGDLTLQVTPRSDEDLMNRALQKTVDNLNEMFHEVQGSSNQVAIGADQIASGAQTLASGSTQQAATLERFTDAISEVLEQSEENARQATITFDDTARAGGLMEESMALMQRLSVSMEEINESSAKIAEVIKVVDDIAFQTNILALNAAVEAARAGEHGKGFAVVADEVRSLAAKSAEAAQQTSAMISANIEKAETGAGQATETSATLQQVADIAAGNAKAMEEIKDASSRQSEAIREINQGISELSGVVHANSATAEESAASAEEMSSQAQMLNVIAGRFKLQDESHIKRLN